MQVKNLHGRSCILSKIKVSLGIDGDISSAASAAVVILNNRPGYYQEDLTDGDYVI